MEYRNLGGTGLRVSVLGFGCGEVGGLMVSADDQQMVRSVARAVEAGINYFDTAQLYGSGRSEENLGRVLQKLKPEVIVGTKIQLTAADLDKLEKKITVAVETSLQRLRVDTLDLLQLHNPISLESQPSKRWVGVDDLQRAVATFKKLQEAGKIRYWGINGIGETEAIHRGVTNSGAYTIQVCYNLLNPSAWYKAPENFPFQDYRELIKTAVEHQVGVIAFRVLAGGALAVDGSSSQVPPKMVEPIASSSKFAADVDLARRFQHLVCNQWAGSLAEAAIRFSLSRPEISTMAIGFSSQEQLELAVKAVERGPLPTEALDQLPEIWQKLQWKATVG